VARFFRKPSLIQSVSPIILQQASINRRSFTGGKGLRSFFANFSHATRDG
jgi:hypothetical protein